MAIKNLLVVLDRSDACRDRVALAADLARRHDAHLTGLALARSPAMPSYVRAQIPDDVMETAKRNLVDELDGMVHAFETTAAGGGLRIEHRRATCMAGEEPQAIGLHARYADLIVLGQEDPSNGGIPPEDVILGSGRPGLVVPYAGRHSMIGEHALIAWDAGREAARAVADAMPILEKAKTVTVLVINPQTSADGHGEEPGADIGLHLARHGITVEVSSMVVQDIDVGNALLSRISDLGADLLVMGAYAHSRLREWILGGATREVLQSMTVPVLMSH